jgi:hypothetical protein
MNTTTRFATMALSFAAVFAATVGSASANLVVNGDFSSISGGPGFAAPAGSTTINGWTVTADTLAPVPYVGVVSPDATTGVPTTFLAGLAPITVAGLGAAENGTNGNFIISDVNADSRGLLSQTLTGLTVGQIYTLSFSYAAGQYSSEFYDVGTTSGWNVTFGNEALLPTASDSISLGQFNGWKTATYSHVAQSTSEVLSFLAFGAPAGLPPAALLDNVSVEANVPEPSTLLLLSLAGVAGLVSRKKKQA